MGDNALELKPRAIPEHYQEVVERSADFICRHQLLSGDIPYYPDGVTDPWDHVECAIALGLCGRFDQSAKAYLWLSEKQNTDGSWHYTYLNGEPQELARDTSHSSYVATGVWHHYLATHDSDFLEQMWPMVEGGIEFALRLQQPTGEVYWALSAADEPWPGALLSTSSCISLNVKNGLKIAKKLGFDRPKWHESTQMIDEAIRRQPHLFDNLGENHRDYAMNWYYPVLCGVLNGEGARERIDERWSEFIVPGWGCMCSLDQPWVTPAETCELIIALSNIGDRERAEILLGWVLEKFEDSDGGFWTGIRVPEGIIYPENEKTTWTTAAVIMAIASLAQ